MTYKTCRAPLWILIATALACGSSTDGGDGDGLTGVSFNESNAEGLASIAVSAIDVFPRLTTAYQGIVDAVQQQSSLSPSAVAKALFELGDIGLCSSGASNLAWDDADDDGSLSAGDTTTLMFADCDGELDGTIVFDFSEVAYALTIAEVALNVTIDSAALPAVALDGRFQIEVNGVPGPPESVIARYLVVDQTEPESSLTATVEGSTQYRMGCFNLYFTFNLEQGSYSLSEPFGVFSIPTAGVMTMEAFGQPPFVFDNGDYPSSGQLALSAASGATPCAALDIGPDGVDSNESATALTATGGGAVTLEGQSSTGAPFTIDTTWDALRR